MTYYEERNMGQFYDNLWELTKRIKSVFEETDSIEYTEDIQHNALGYSKITMFPTEPEDRIDLGELLISVSLAQSEITVKRVLFQSRHRGGMTKLFNLLKQFCLDNSFKSIRVESVLTLEMASWCKKMGFEPNFNTGMMLELTSLDGKKSEMGFSGDYIYQVF